MARKLDGSLEDGAEVGMLARIWYETKKIRIVVLTSFTWVWLSFLYCL